jgi:hypothetical protein
MSPKEAVTLAKVASAFVQFQPGYQALEMEIISHANDLTSDQRAQVSRWINSASAMVLQAHKSLDTGGQG